MYVSQASAKLAPAGFHFQALKTAVMTTPKSISSFFQAPKRLRIEEAARIAVDAGICAPRITSLAPNQARFPEWEGLTERSLKAPNNPIELSQELETERKYIDSGSDVVACEEEPGVVSKQGKSGECHEYVGQQPLEMSREQKWRMEINKAAARAKRNLRLCADGVEESRARGMPCSELGKLLVEQSWVEALPGEVNKPYMEKLAKFVGQEVAGKIPIYPPLPMVFNAFNTCPFEAVKVVILGQDPYHGQGQAMGLSFSVPQGIKPPSSLVNIFKEVHADVGCSIPSHGNLEKWAYQGVLLLNTVLTVRDHHANSHAKKGWELFTDAAIRTVSQRRSGVVFLLWGNSAQEKTRLINAKVHHILRAAHPSGLSAHRGFFGCRHFSQTNQLLEKDGQLPIDWQL